MTDPIRKSVAKRLYPEAWYFAGSDADKCAALAKADYAIRAVTGALEAQGYVVVREPACQWERDLACRADKADCVEGGCAKWRASRAASNKETGR